VRRKISASVDGGPSRGSRVRRLGFFFVLLVGLLQFCITFRQDILHPIAGWLTISEKGEQDSGFADWV
jgi:hypothetical protein